MQTNLDMWKARDLTLFGRGLIIKSLGLSELVYSASNLSFSKEITPVIKTNCLTSYRKTKEKKIEKKTYV